MSLSYREREGDAEGGAGCRVPIQKQPNEKLFTVDAAGDESSGRNSRGAAVLQKD